MKKGIWINISDKSVVLKIINVKINVININISLIREKINVFNAAFIV